MSRLGKIVAGPHPQILKFSLDRLYIQIALPCIKPKHLGNSIALKVKVYKKTAFLVLG